jgi:hypothetical protein
MKKNLILMVFLLPMYCADVCPMGLCSTMLVVQIENRIQSMQQRCSSVEAFLREIDVAGRAGEDLLFHLLSSLHNSLKFPERWEKMTDAGVSMETLRNLVVGILEADNSLETVESMLGQAMMGEVPHHESASEFMIRALIPEEDRLPAIMDALLAVCWRVSQMENLPDDVAALMNRPEMREFL